MKNWWNFQNSILAVVLLGMSMSVGLSKWALDGVANNYNSFDIVIRFVIVGILLAVTIRTGLVSDEAREYNRLSKKYRDNLENMSLLGYLMGLQDEELETVAQNRMKIRMIIDGHSILMEWQMMPIENLRVFIRTELDNLSKKMEASKEPTKPKSVDWWEKTILRQVQT